MAKFLKSQVIENKKLNNKFYHLTLKALDEPFSFQAGQFVVLKIPDNVFRSYSIASTPSKTPLWEMLVDISPQGPGTRYIKQLKAQDIIETSQPCGIFTCKDDSCQVIVLGATGCGIASIKPMIEEIILNPQLKVKLFWGLRYHEDLFWQELFTQWQSAYPNFEYDIILSQPQDNWQGQRGHINPHLCQYLKKQDYQKTAAYLCGNSKMIDEIKKELAAINFPYDRIYFEKTY